MMQLYTYGHPPLYDGTKDGDKIIRPPKIPLRRRLNLISICLSLFVPWLIFCCMSAIFSFRLFYVKPAVSWAIAVCAFLFVAFLGVKAFGAVYSYMRGHDSFYEPTWYVFLFFTSCFAWAIGLYLGIHNYYDHMQSYYGVSSLGNYRDVDPAKMRGQQLMDAGRVLFKNGSYIDLTKSMSFRNNDLYCVAPIVNADHNLHGSEAYDFWAVGLNCCCGDTLRDAKFQCDDYDNKKAYAGLRLMNDDQRPFFRLAVQQAVGTYGIKSNHPLFFHWVLDPVASASSWNWEGHRQFMIGAYAHFIFQLVCVCIATWVFSSTPEI